MRSILALYILVCLGPVCAAGVAAAATVADEVKRLRTEANELDAAVTLAQQYLDANPELTLDRQRVHYELGATLYAAKDYTAAANAFRALVADYSTTALDKADEAFVVDDAQFYVGVIEHYFGDRAKGIEGYTEAIDDFPKSNRRPQALMLLAGVYEQDGEKAKALGRFKQLVAEHPKSEQAPEAQLHVGHLLRADGKLDEAIAAFQGIPKDWPDTRHAPMALLNANRTLMEQELKEAEASDVQKDDVICNEDAILANVKLLMEKYGKSEEVTQVMQDLINYYSSPVQLVRDSETLANVKPIVDWLREHKPGARQTLRATCEYAVMLDRDHLDEALAELDWTADFAREANDESLLFDVEFARARVLSQAGRTDEAREIWTKLLERASTDHLADEIRLILVTLDPIEERLLKLDEIANDEQRQRDIRSTAMMLLAVDHYREDRYEEAKSLVDEIVANYADTVSVYAAKSLRDTLKGLLDVPIENRGDYVRR